MLRYFASATVVNVSSYITGLQMVSIKLFFWSVQKSLMVIIIENLSYKIRKFITFEVREHLLGRLLIVRTSDFS